MIVFSATKKRVGLLLATFTLALVLTACGPFKAPSEAAKAWFAVLRDDSASAYEMTDSSFKDYTSQEDFDAFLADNPFLQQVKEARFNDFSIENGEADLRGTLLIDDGTTSPILVILTSADGTNWAVAGIDLNPAPPADSE